MLVIVAISFSQAVCVDVGRRLNALVPAARARPAMDKGLPAQVDVAHGWIERRMAREMAAFGP